MYESEEAESRVRKEPNARLSSVAVRDAGSERSCKVSTLLHILLMLLTVHCTANFHLYLYAEAWVLQAQKSSRTKVFPGWGPFVICTCHVIRRGPGRRSRTGATQPMIRIDPVQVMPQPELLSIRLFFRLSLPRA